MKATTYSDFRRNLSAMIDGVADDHEPVLITRNGGKAAAVLMSLEDFASFEETRHLLSSRENSKRLLDAVKELDADKGIEMALID
ncbi:MAG: type II toxin-antitoxin system prevent-host-death family antitoxin [Rhodobacteraceae bacterium]|nr:type II toxin-antitoxin system prevent-host-death family antitoxin [Paracoccaceae bacterium]